MNPRLRQIVRDLQAARRQNPPKDLVDELQKRVVTAGLKQSLSESDLIAAAKALGVDPGDFMEELASWL
jgi:hypothetical protein